MDKKEVVAEDPCSHFHPESDYREKVAMRVIEILKTFIL